MQSFDKQNKIANIMLVNYAKWVYIESANGLVQNGLFDFSSQSKINKLLTYSQRNGEIMRIHLYIVQSQHIREIQEKYHVSLSTIMDVLLHQLAKYYIPNGVFDSEYINKDTKIQTNIMVNKENKQLIDTILRPKSEVRYLSNLYEIYRKLITYDSKNPKFKNYDLYPLDKDKIPTLKMEIHNELAKKREIYWNYNQLYRNNYRARKQYDREQERKNNQ